MKKNPIVHNPWKRRGFSYVASETRKAGPYLYTATKRLGFFSYHLIRWYHGEAKLIEMARYLDEELAK